MNETSVSGGAASRRESPGGDIAGRATALYKSGEKRPDGDVAMQVCSDEKVGITLINISTVYSKQIGQVVSRKTEECKSIQFGPVDPASFNKP